MSGSIRVLHVEDDPDLAALTAEWLERESEAVTVVTAHGVTAGLERLEDESVDCVVSDYDLPDADGLTFLEELRERDERLPFILYTGKGSEEVASDALAAGATDYLQKETGTDQYAVLANRIENAVSRERAVAALERQNDLHESAEEIADLGAWEFDLETGEIWLSDGAYRTLGLPEDYEPSLEVGLEHYHPEDRETVRSAFRAAIEDGESFDIEVRHVGGDDRRWVRVRGDPKVEDGEVVGVRETIQDVTDRVERERDLERYETIVQAAGDPVYTLDTDGCFTFVNDALLSITGFDKEEMLGSHVSSFMDEEGLTAGQQAVQRLLADDDRRRATFEMEGLTAEGERIPSEVHAALLPSEDGFGGTVGVVRDLRDRKCRERRLRRFRAMVEGVPVGVFLLDEDGVIVESNEAAAEIMGLDRENWLGEPFRGLVDRGIVPESAVERYVDRIRDLLSEESDTEMATLQTEVSPPDADETRTVRAHVSLLPSDSEFAGAVGAYRDVTAERAHQEALERKDRRIAELADIVSHDLRNPMNVVNSRIALARDDLPADHESVAHLESATGAIARMDRILEDTVTLCRDGGHVEELTAVTLADVARRTWLDEADDAALRIEDEVTITADPDRLETVLEHCFENAIDHGGDDVTVRLGALDGEDGPSGFYVADDGPGIPVDERDAVREPGYSTGRGGTGLGLTVVEELVGAHGWELTITESEAGGARIEVVGAETEV